MCLELLQLQQYVVDFTRRLELIKTIMNDMKELQNLSRYPY